MAEQSSTWMTTREATQLADKLSRYGGKHSVATHIAIMEVQVPSGVPAHPGDAAAGAFQRRIPAPAGRMIAVAAPGA
jgi:hypothetical protein